MFAERASPTEVLSQDVYDPFPDRKEPKGNSSVTNDDALLQALSYILVISH